MSDKYVKLIDGHIFEAPENYNGIMNYNLDVERMIEDGWKLYVPTERPVTNRMFHIEYEEDEDSIAEVVVFDETQEEADAREARQEAERIAMLHLTRGDVFRGLLQAKGVTRAQIRALIEAMPDETPEQQFAKEMALIDFDEALEFYRGVTLISTLGAQLGITPGQMTAFFETNDWHELIKEQEA